MLFAGDTPPGMAFEGMKGVMLALQYDTIDQAHSAFHALSQGGQVTMPLAPAFWAKTFGMLTDRFGVSWAVNGEPVPIRRAARSDDAMRPQPDDAIYAVVRRYADAWSANDRRPSSTATTTRWCSTISDAARWPAPTAARLPAWPC